MTAQQPEQRQYCEHWVVCKHAHALLYCPVDATGKHHKECEYDTRTRQHTPAPEQDVGLVGLAAINDRLRLLYPDDFALQLNEQQLKHQQKDPVGTQYDSGSGHGWTKIPAQQGKERYRHPQRCDTCGYCRASKDLEGYTHRYCSHPNNQYRGSKETIIMGEYYPIMYLGCASHKPKQEPHP